jgi:hypothetical protein
MHRAIHPLAVIAAVVLASAVTPMVDAPDLCVNPISGLIETVDAAWSGSNYNVRSMQVTPTGDQVSSTVLSSNAANDVDPRVAVAPVGDVVVVWWRDLASDAVLYRKRSLATGVWGTEHAVGATYESNSRPRIVFADGTAWVAYQIQNSKNRSVGAQIIDDDPEPFRSIVATTSYSGLLEVQIKSESHHVWITWVDSGSRVGYSEYDPTKLSWSVPAFESFAADSAPAARARIRARVLGL